MKIKINDESTEVPKGSTIDDLCNNLRISTNGIVVSINGEIIPKVSFSRYKIMENAVVEIMVFVGGG